MRRIPCLMVAAAFTAGAAGCLDSIIPYRGGSVAPDLGVVQAPQNGTAGDDAGMAADPDAGGGAAAIPNDPNCINTALPVIDGHHNAGQACLTCHDGKTAGANVFTAAGTVYSLIIGGTGVSGVTVELVDAAGTKVQVVTASTGAPGNWWTDKPLVFPLQVRASQCPADRPMPDAVAAGGGNCASGVGCHDTNNQMHMP